MGSSTKGEHTLEPCLFHKIREEATHVRKRVTKMWGPHGVLIDIPEDNVQISGSCHNMAKGSLEDWFICFNRT